MAYKGGGKYRDKTAVDIIFLAIQMLILFLFFVFPGIHYFDWPKPVFWTGSVIAAVGLLFSVVAIANLGDALSPYASPAPKGNLVTHGLYGYIRHPLYTGILIIFLGLALAFSMLSKFIILFIALLFFIKKAKYEESLLLKKYPDYKQYREENGMFFPKS